MSMGNAKPLHERQRQALIVDFKFAKLMGPPGAPLAKLILQFLRLGGGANSIFPKDKFGIIVASLRQSLYP